MSDIKAIAADIVDGLRDKIEEAILDERKRCAKLADDSPYPDGMDIAYLILNQGKPNE